MCVTFGTRIPFRGSVLEILPHGKNFVKFYGNKLLVPEHKKDTGTITMVFLQTFVQKQLEIEATRYAQQLNENYTKISLRDVRSRWASCSERGALMFSWRLVMAPPSVLSYVVAHEVAHLRHMNHSERFWKQVFQLYGNHEKERLWLRKNGPILHSFAFSS